MKPIFTALGTTLGGLLLGAGAMYYLDPEQGRRRRALVADRVDSVSHDARDYLESRRKRTSDRVRGLLATIRSRLSSQPLSDEQLNGQIRSRLGRIVSYPHAIETEVRQGRVLLRGAVLESEYNSLMADIWSMRGVTAIDSQLSLHSEPGNVPGMQGKPHRPRKARLRSLARNAAAVLAFAGGLGAGLGAMRSPGKANAGMLSLALALLAYGVGDGTRQIVRRRRGRITRAKPQAATESRPEQRPERVGEPQPALLNPAAWH